MWKPGTKKPVIEQEQTSDVMSAQADMNSASISSRKRNLPEPNNTDATNNKSTKQSPKALSGSTMNMKFMKRKAMATQPDPINSKTKSTSSASGMEIDGPTDSPDDIETNVQEIKQDMYGLGAVVLGRRSFGGFNLKIEEQWRASHQAHKKNSTRQKVSDEELLQRYKDLVRSTNRANGKRKR